MGLRAVAGGSGGGAGLATWAAGQTFQPGAMVFGPKLTPYPGLAATGGLIPFFQSGSLQMGNRKRCTATADLSTFRMLFLNCKEFGEPTGATMPIWASVEYPQGTYTQAKFSGVAGGVIPDGGGLWTDDITVAIPKGAHFWVHSYATNAVGVIAARMTTVRDYDYGEFRESGASGITNKTMGGTYENLFPTYIYGPSAIVGQTTGPSVLVIGSSTSGGFNNEGGLPYGPDNGTITPSLAPTIGNTLLAAYGRTAQNANDAGSLLTDMIGPYVTHVVCALGQNDIRNGADMATVLSRLAAFKAKYATGKPIFGQTFGPDTDSTDEWATTGNQTPRTGAAVRVQVNNAVRAGLAGWQGYFEIADQWESARNSGLWKVPAWTDDGLHAQAIGYEAIKINNVVDPARFISPSASAFTIYKMIGASPVTSSTPPYADAANWLAQG
jgi:hypothetical protein